MKVYNNQNFSQSFGKAYYSPEAKAFITAHLQQKSGSYVSKCEKYMEKINEIGVTDVFFSVNSFTKKLQANMDKYKRYMLPFCGVKTFFKKVNNKLLHMYIENFYTGNPHSFLQDMKATTAKEVSDAAKGKIKTTFYTKLMEQ